MAPSARPLRGAIELGLTATPKRDSHVDSYAYFGDPVFEYSLRQGIEDGFLAPFRVRRVVLSPDAEGWSPDDGQLDRFGREIPDGLYSTRDFERVVLLLVRTELAANHLSAILRRDPTARGDGVLRGPAARRGDATCPRRREPRSRCARPRVGGADRRRRAGEGATDEVFTDAQSASPVVATTSRLLSTGVDVEDLKFVVLFRPIGSMVEFKQIIGRGTRLYPAKGKTSFEIVDYVGATAKFDDPDFDGPPMRTSKEQVDGSGDVTATTDGEDDEVTTPDDQSVAEPDPGFQPSNPDGPVPPDPAPVPAPVKLYVDDGDFHVVAEAVQVPDTSTGRLRLTEYGEHVKGVVRSIATSADPFAARWARSPSRTDILEELAARGVTLAELSSGRTPADTDPLDVLLQVAWDVPARTRAERAGRVRRHTPTRSPACRRSLNRSSPRCSTGMQCTDSTTSRPARCCTCPPCSASGRRSRSLESSGALTAWHDQLDRLQGWLYSA